ncbi:MAG: DUF4115 domain-containing protein [Firmicutes bacterium]|nr:DUF4115 domain-containing protein [Bacillota bacterium]
MKEIGSMLKEAREKKGISIDDISNETKIQKRFLHLMEKGDFSAFPGEVYLRGALRNFAESVGLDPVEIISLYKQSVKSENAYEVKTEKVKIRKDGTSPVIGKGKKNLPVTALTWIMLLVFIIGGGIWYRHQQLHQDGEKIPYPNTISGGEQSDGPKDLDFNEIAPVDELPEVGKLTLISSDSREIVYLLSGAEQQKITLSFTGECWFKFEQDGRLIKEKTCRAGEIESFGDSSETRFRLGNPPAVKIKVNEFEIDDLTNYSRPVNIIIKKEI